MVVKHEICSSATKLLSGFFWTNTGDSSSRAGAVMRAGENLCVRRCCRRGGLGYAIYPFANDWGALAAKSSARREVVKNANDDVLVDRHESICVF